MKASSISKYVLALSLFAAPVFAAPGAAPGDGAVDPSAHLEILAPLPGAPASATVVPGSLIMTPGSPSTILMPSPIATTVGSTAVNTPPQFARLQNAPRPTDDPIPWTVEVNALLRQSALAGNALFLIYDAQDSNALPSHEVTALWQAPIAAGKSVNARVSLSPDDGFRPGHNYLIQVAQIVNGKELVLAEGELRLQ